jgi:hypothetical protein
MMRRMIWVGLNHMGTFGVYPVVLAGTSPNIWSCTVYKYGSGQPYALCKCAGNIFGTHFCQALDFVQALVVQPLNKSKLFKQSYYIY